MSRIDNNVRCNGCGVEAALEPSALPADALGSGDPWAPEGWWTVTPANMQTRADERHLCPPCGANKTLAEHLALVETCP